MFDFGNLNNHTFLICLFFFFKFMYHWKSISCFIREISIPAEECKTWNIWQIIPKKNNQQHDQGSDKHASY